MVSIHSLGNRDTDKEDLVNADHNTSDTEMSCTSRIDSIESNQLMAEYNSEGDEIGDDLSHLLLMVKMT